MAAKSGSSSRGGFCGPASHSSHLQASFSENYRGYNRTNGWHASYAELKAAFETSVDHTRGVITIKIGDAFESALGSSENIAERRLVEALAFGTSELVRTPLEAARASEIVKKICPSPHARGRHLIQAQNFRDMIRGASGKPVTIHLMDDAMSRVGLAFRVRQGVGSEVTGTNECTAFLNRACQYALEELCALLRSFDRSGSSNWCLEPRISSHKPRVVASNRACRNWSPRRECS